MTGKRTSLKYPQRLVVPNTFNNLVKFAFGVKECDEGYGTQDVHSGIHCEHDTPVMGLVQNETRSEHTKSSNCETR